MVNRSISQSEKEISRHRPVDEFTVIPLQQVRLLIPASQRDLLEGIKSGMYLQPIRVGKRKRGWLLADVQMLVGATVH